MVKRDIEKAGNSDFAKTVDFADVFEQEQERRDVSGKLWASTDGEMRARVGLALSGGGIRSAAFSLGVLQSLNANGIFRAIDYLSTVSGGGYIGAALIARLANPKRQPDEFPFAGGAGTSMDGLGANDIADNATVRNIRDRSRYLMPKGKFDLVISLAILLRGLLVNAVIVATAIFFATAATLLVSPTRDWLDHSRLRLLFGLTPGEPVANDATFAMIVGFLGETMLLSKILIIMLCLFLVLWAVGRSAAGNGRPIADTETWGATWSGWALVGVFIVMIADLQPVVLNFLLQFIDEPGRVDTYLARFDKLAASLAAGTGILALSWRTLSGIIKNASKDATWGATIRKATSTAILFVLALALPLLIYVCYLRLSLSGIVANDAGLPTTRLMPLSDVYPALSECLGACLSHIPVPVAVLPPETFLPLMSPAGSEGMILFSVVAGLGLVLVWMWKEREDVDPEPPVSRRTVIALVLFLAAGLCAAALLSLPGGTLLSASFYLLLPVVLLLIFDRDRVRAWCTWRNGLVLLGFCLAVAAIYFIWPHVSIFGRGLGARMDSAVLAHLSAMETSPLRVAVEVAAYGICLALVSLLFSENANSLHSLYRGRLHAAFDYAIDPATSSRPALFSDLEKVRPYPIVNAAMNIQGSEKNNRGRNADFFMLTPHYIGSELTGYVSTRDYEARENKIDLATAVAISGAAASAGMGKGTIAVLAPTLALLNVRLAFWLRNPAFVLKAAMGAVKTRPRDWKLFYLWLEMFGLLDEKRSKVYVSDGGHIDNLGIYQLLKRRCDVIIVVDAEQDPAMTFPSFVDVQRYARIDLGVRIVLPIEELRAAALARKAKLTAEGGLSAASTVHGHAAIGTISYPAMSENGKVIRNEKEGIILYVKATVTGDENTYVLDYERRYPLFPHESTGDQFFSEEQFEAYRALGFHSFARAWQETEDDLTTESLRERLRQTLSPG